jgi:hypothetical protein
MAGRRTFHDRAVTPFCCALQRGGLLNTAIGLSFFAMRKDLRLERETTSVSETVGVGRQRLKCDGTRAETRFRLLAKRTSPFKAAGASVQSTTGSRGVRISGSNAGYTMFPGSVKNTGYPLLSPVFPSLSLSCVTVCHSHFNWTLPVYTASHHIKITFISFSLKTLEDIGREETIWKTWALMGRLY